MTEKEKFIEELQNRKNWDTPFLIKMLKQKGLGEEWDKSLTTPVELKIGDIYISNYMSHPALIIKIHGDNVTSVILSTKEASHNIYQITYSRFFRGSYVTLTVMNTSIGAARAKYLGSIDGKEDMKHIMKMLRARYKEELSLRPKKQLRIEEGIIFAEENEVQLELTGNID